MIPLHAAILILVFLLGNAWGETYRWTDDQGNLCLSDNLASVPERKRNQVKVEDDITLANPEVRGEVEQGRKLAAATEKQEKVLKLVRDRERAQREYQERQKEREASAKKQIEAQRAQQNTIKPVKRRKIT